MRLTLLAAVLGAGFWLLRTSGLTVYLTLDNLHELSLRVRGLGWIAPAAYMGLWVAACLFFLPGLPITLLGALFFGAWWGIFWVAIGANLGVNCAFLAARYALRPLV